MQEEHGLTPPQRELELALKSVAPCGMRVDPVAAAFLAGRRSGRRQARLWQGAAALVLVAAIGSWMLPVPHPGSASHSDPAGLAVVPGLEPRAVPPLAKESILFLQAAVSQRGIDGLPETHLSPARRIGNTDTF